MHRVCDVEQHIERDGFIHVWHFNLTNKIGGNMHFVCQLAVIPFSIRGGNRAPMQTGHLPVLGQANALFLHAFLPIALWMDGKQKRQYCKKESSRMDTRGKKICSISASEERALLRRRTLLLRRRKIVDARPKTYRWSKFFGCGLPCRSDALPDSRGFPLF